MHVDHARCDPLASRIDDIGIRGAQARANFRDLAIDEQNISIIQPISGAGQNRRAGQERRSGWQSFVAALVRRGAVSGAVFFAVSATGRSQ